MNLSTEWDSRFLDLAALVASWSKDPSTQVGCVIVDPYNRVVSTGFNGLPRGIKDTAARLENRATKYDLVIHAEENALLFARQSFEGCTAYVYPILPCSRCAAKLIQAGIKRVVSVPTLTDADTEKWQHEWLLAEEMYKEVGVS